MSKIINIHPDGSGTFLIPLEKLDLYLNLKQYLVQCNLGEPYTAISAAPELDRHVYVYKYPSQPIHDAQSNDTHTTNCPPVTNSGKSEEWFLFAVPYRGTEVVDAEAMENYLTWIKGYIASNSALQEQDEENKQEEHSSKKRSGFRAFIAVVDSSSAVVMFRVRPGMHRISQDKRREWSCNTKKSLWMSSMGIRCNMRLLFDQKQWNISGLQVIRVITINKLMPNAYSGNGI